MDIYWRIVPVWGHYELWVNGRFWCSADTYKEAFDELEKIRE